ncbi:hypothetical protein [Cellulomonas sp. P24]|uniref:hypothetical protein n=1 Tax=Cellulomonas sp. P24 TaxID=2885206 RepID=UPI00216B299C|nr:hypothetical protein [Cellulomonas sp. P24]MCR6491152.1 hypothetical protein [Cellulomonas sp. P24]
MSGTGSTFDVGWVSAALALLALLVSLLNRRASESVYTTALRKEWEDLHDHWSRSLLLARNPDDYYVDAPVELRSEIRKLVKRVDDFKSTDYADPNYGRELTDIINSLREETAHVRTVVRFLAHAADLMLEGSLSVTSLYSMFGPDVSRHAHAIRWMIGSQSPQEFATPPTGAGSRLFSQVPEGMYRGEQERVLLLLDLLWSEVAKRGDNEPHSILGVASHKKRSGSGVTCRKRLWRLSSGVSPIRWATLRRQLRFAELVPYQSVCVDGALTVGQWDPWLVRRGRVPILSRLIGAASAHHWYRTRTM